MNGLDSSACAYYRMILPIRTMEELGFPVESIIDNMKVDTPSHMRAAAFMESDFSVVYQSLNPMTAQMMEATKKFKPLKNDDDILQWPPTFIVDTDDDLFNIMPLNVTFGKLGTRDHNGEPLKDGAEIGIGHPFDVAPPQAHKALMKQHPRPLSGAKA